MVKNNNIDESIEKYPPPESLGLYRVMNRNLECYEVVAQSLTEAERKAGDIKGCENAEVKFMAFYRIIPRCEECKHLERNYPQTAKDGKAPYGITVYQKLYCTLVCYSIDDDSVIYQETGRPGWCHISNGLQKNIDH